MQSNLPEGSAQSDRNEVAGTIDERTYRVPSLEGRRFCLVPVTPEVHRALYQLSITQQHNYRWRFRGGIPPFETFAATIHNNMLIQFAVVLRSNPGVVAGHVIAYDGNLQDGTCYLGAVSDPRLAASLEASVLFVRYLFAHWQFRKIYLRTSALSIGQFSSGLRTGLMREEARLVDHVYFDHQYWDDIILAIYRENADAWRERYSDFFDEVERHAATEIDP